MIRAVAFDLDDTLVVTDEDRETVLRRAATEAGVPLEFGRDDYLRAHREYSGEETRLPVFRALVGDSAPELTRAYRRAIHEAMVPAAGAAALIETLRDRYRVGLLTDGPDRTQRDKLRYLGWNDAFDAVVVTGPFGAPKPDPRGFEALTETLEVPAEETVYLGDDPERDVVGATEAGMHAVQVVYDGGPDPHPRAAATLSRDRLPSLPALLESRFGDGADDA